MTKHGEDNVYLIHMDRFEQARGNIVSLCKKVTKKVLITKLNRSSCNLHVCQLNNKSQRARRSGFSEW